MTALDHIWFAPDIPRKFDAGTRRRVGALFDHVLRGTTIAFREERLVLLAIVRGIELGANFTTFDLELEGNGIPEVDGDRFSCSAENNAFVFLSPRRACAPGAWEIILYPPSVKLIREASQSERLGAFQRQAAQLSSQFPDDWMGPIRSWPELSTSAIERIEELKTSLAASEAHVVDEVFSNINDFVKFPHLRHTWMKTVRRSVHKFDFAQMNCLRNAGLPRDGRSNGPAILGFQLCGGTRPVKADGHGWHVHHLYDGRFPFPGKTKSLRAVENPDYFTDSAGLVAAHPIANALATDIPYFTWRLRAMAYERFGFDPDGVLAT